MASEEPSWWYAARPGWQAWALAPAAGILGALARRRMAREPRYVSRLPVFCVGNFTAGGTGKTPLSIALADIVRELGREPVFLTRGYGGSAKGPLHVDAHTSIAADTGDEPLLLARAAHTVVARDRVAGARFIEETIGPNAVILMDDGLQNPALHKSFSIAVVDIRRRFGNGRCLPAGPLRAPLSAQLSRVNAILLSGADDPDSEAHARSMLQPLYRGPVLRAQVAPAGDLKWLQGASVLAFAGIANPERFFALLEREGARLALTRTFPDHHIFTAKQACELIALAESHGARLITTEKDFVRLHGATGACGELRSLTLTLPVTMRFAPGDLAALKAHVAKVLETGPR